MYKVLYTEQAIKDIERIKKSGDKVCLRKLAKLLDELYDHPRTGTGQIEQLKHYSSETWARRLNNEHRLVYRIYDDTVEVLVLSAFGHY